MQILWFTEAAGLKYESYIWSNVVGVKRIPIAQITKPEVAPIVIWSCRSINEG